MGCAEVRGRARRLACASLCLAVFAVGVAGCGDSDPVPPRRDGGSIRADGGSAMDATVPVDDDASGMFPDDDDDASIVDDAGDDGAQGDAAGDDAGGEPYAPPEDLDGLVFNPQFEADYNTLVPQPWVEVLTTAQAAAVVVRPDKLIFPLSAHPEVLDWERGRVSVSGPSDGTGSNPMGFARRVVSVSVVGDTIEVVTETAALQDIVTGDLQQTLDFDKLLEVDMAKLDLDWAAKNLYLDVDVLTPDSEFAPDDEPMPDLDENDEPVPGDPFFGKVFNAVKKGVTTVAKAVGGAASAVANVAGTVWRAVTPASFTGSASITSEIKIQHATDLFRVTYEKTFNESGRTPVSLSIKGSGSIDADVSFKPGVQLGMRIPNIGHNTTFATWLNVDSQYRSRIELGVDLEAEVASANNMRGPELYEKIAEGGAFAADVLTQANEKFLGNPDLKPAGGWKKTLLITKPSMQIVFAGPIPVVFTQTFQLDMECGFAAKAQLQARMLFERNTNLKFSMHYESGRVTGTTPVFENRKNRSVMITGGGSVQVSCGLIPRVNVFVYDTAGMFAGVRGSLVAEARYQSMCEADPLISKTRAEVGVGLYANFGVQIGARLQAPGSSYAGTAGQKAGTDIGPFEPWNTQIPIYEHIWKLNSGIGYCTPTCRNTTRDARETDLNCGGGSCNACGEAKMCAKNSDCAKGYCTAGVCSNDHCGDGVLDGDETGIDCGGSRCKKCRPGVGCYAPRDCASGYCAVRPGAGSKLGYCVQSHCADLVMSADESGLDCGGSTCAKCEVGARSVLEADCSSGFADDGFCVAGTCRDHEVGAGESGVDCGGSSSCGRCGRGLGCSNNSDCARTAPVCDPSTKLCERPMCDDGVRNVDETDIDCGGSCTGCQENQACLQRSDCATGLDCDPTARVCVTPSCTDGWRNGSETDVDCGGSCEAKCELGEICQNNTDCAASAPNCDTTSHTCTEFVCPAGQYAVGQSCTQVGVGFWSPASDRSRYACTNKPAANSTYTSATATSAECPWSCNPGFLNTNGQCIQNANARYLNCSSNQVAIGVNGRVGAWLDALGMICAPFNGTQVTGGAVNGPRIGGNGGDEFVSRCGDNEIIHQITGYNGWAPSPSWCSAVNLSKLTISCRHLLTGVVRTLPEVGGQGACQTPGGPAFSYQCPNGQFILGTVVDSANTTTYVGHMYGTACR